MTLLNMIRPAVLTNHGVEYTGDASVPVICQRLRCGEMEQTALYRNDEPPRFVVGPDVIESAPGDYRKHERLYFKPQPQVWGNPHPTAEH
jgi:hypothetical protein